MSLYFKHLDANSVNDIIRLKKLLEDTPKYSLIVKGRLPLISDVTEIFAELPPGKTLNDKIVGGYFLDNEIVGCLEICNGYPEPHTAYIGLLLFAEKYQGQGFGREALKHICLLVDSWNCTTIRIAVIDKNIDAFNFWKNVGFVELYRKKIPAYLGEAVVMEIKAKGYQ
jgi:GNAT superfamily N-acetyltransferase